MANERLVTIPYAPRFLQRRMHDGMESKRFSVIVAHRRFGKALCIKTPIPMAEGGWKNIGDIVDGDKVFDELGNVCKVLKAHDIIYDRPCYRVVFSDGNEVVCDEEHLWPTQTKLDRCHRVGRKKSGNKKDKLGCVVERGCTAKNTKEIIATLTYCGESNHSIQVCEPVQYEKKNLLIEPYLLGVWLGDGTSRSNQITTEDLEIVERFQEYASKTGGVIAPVKNQNAGKATTYKITNGFGSILSSLNLFKNKHIPPVFLYSSIEDRIELLRGLMDTDGSISKANSVCEFSQKNNKLSENFCELISGLGIKYSKYKKIIDGEEYHRYSFRPKFNPFRLKRKSDRFFIPKRRDGQTRYIVDIKHVESRPVRCLTVDSGSSLYLCGTGFIPTHNTVAVINHLIKSACTNQKKSPRYGYVAPYRTQAEQIAWSYLKRFSAPIPGVKANESKLEVLLPNGSSIRLYGADNPDALRGVYFDGVVLDEVAQMRPEIWEEIIPPTIADRNGFVVFIGTPKGLNLFHAIYESGCREENKTMYYVDVFTVEHTDALPETEIELQRRTLPPNKFRQEYLCDFSADVENAMISLELVNAAYGRSIHFPMYQNAPIVIGVDVARFGDDKSVIYVRQGLATLEIKRFIKTDLVQLSENIMAMYPKYKPDAVFVDDVGIGAGIIDMLRSKDYECNGVNGGGKPSDESMFFNKRAEMWWRISDWLAAGGCIPDDPELRKELTAPTYTYDAANRIRLEKKEDMKARGLSSPDCADALAMTFSIPVNRRFNEMQSKYDSIVRSKPFDPFDCLKTLQV